MRNIMAQLIVLTSVTAITGCATWPAKGQGGWGESFPHTLSPVEFEQPLQPHHGQRFELELASRHLDTLVLEGANYCFPATVFQARLRENRILRELLGGLNFDATSHLLIQRKVLSDLEKQLDMAKHSEACLPPNRILITKIKTKRAKASPLKHLIFLLNSDNQFAHNSFQLNPKYVTNLTKASSILNQHSQYKLYIEGHADITGTETGNIKLAKKRAERVAKQLQTHGIDKSRITIGYQGSSQPLVAGNEPHIRLTNRRVMISINGPTNAASTRK